MQSKRRPLRLCPQTVNGMCSNMLDDTLILKGLNPTVYYYKHPSGRPLNVWPCFATTKPGLCFDM